MPGYFDLNNRVALVTGASRGLGLAMAEALAEVGATVRDANTLKTAADRIRDRGLKAETSAFDVIRNGVTFILGRAGELEHARWRSRPRLF
jgi:gluconate 5-dehydrogenase